ncbi:conserved hypothetical protein [Leishmania major strain Friedlin]|uniref:Uncharacterized protein n=1 Tax=Leishmania major TaxID=5664 RepID=E9AED1_LEIMA|nr:conserved hypothetical protein [Leishmania major strain Friedlin]CAG9578011.1 hypothetical_protein_-_conserved [Leishmania major strain Friedlin]CBZ12610.1 conserved hypothetical protein [Leishmania major strain Friedlin]|eukprot:XP_003722352.1 conserved hypothetical protein [Leishmania major strain Friedlin]
MDSTDRKADKALVAPPKMDSAVKGAKPGSFALSDVVTGYAGAEDGPLVQQLPMPSHIMPYYGQYPAMCALPPGAAPMGFPMPPQTGVGSPQMWMPGMVPPPPGANPNATLTPHPYVSQYGAGAQPVMYMPMSYSYPPCMAATAVTPAAAMGASFNGQQPAKPAPQGATPPYTSTMAAPPHPHSNAAETPVLSSPFMDASSANSTAPALPVAPVPVPVPSMTPIEFSVMPLMPNTKLPPGDPFCPAGATVPSQYATASAACFSDAAAVDASLSPRPHPSNGVTNDFPTMSQQGESQTIGVAAAAGLSVS